jgi:hypothetical protein
MSLIFLPGCGLHVIELFVEDEGKVHIPTFRRDAEAYSASVEIQ